MKTLKAVNHELSVPLVQIEKLEGSTPSLPSFEEKLAAASLSPLRPVSIETLQVNVGKMCNQTCAHCHVDAGPDRDEIMTRQTMESCLEALRNSSISTVDITGGAPEMNPNFRWFVQKIRESGCKVIVRSNLTILTVNKTYRSLPAFFAENVVTVVSSLPCYTAENTDKQRGEGVFQKSVNALRTLNAVGYGSEGSGLELNLVYNPLGAFLPPSQQKLEADYKRILKDQFGIEFNNLFCITNMPISRFLEWLFNTQKYEAYMQTLVDSFNASSAAGVMCRNLISVGWDGQIYDCDFNQMLELKADLNGASRIEDFDEAKLLNRRIVLKRHCFGCTAGAGSSCGGELV